ncbi:UNVERIFIED_CONTAM: hypothetical protein K2H54_034066 [Gekko kuhli]
MSEEEEINVSVSTGETAPVSSGTETVLSDQGAGEMDTVPNLFGGTHAMITTRQMGPRWDQFSMDTHETWTHRGSRYETSGGMGTILEDPGTDAGQDSETLEYFLDTRLGILERGYDRIMQMVKNSLANIPELVGDAIQRELQLYATFDGTLEKLAFFVVRLQKYVMNWCHLFPNDEQRMDYITSHLRAQC